MDNRIKEVMSYETDFAPKIEAKKIGSAGNGEGESKCSSLWKMTVAKTGTSS